MCADYWNLEGVAFQCLECGAANEDANLQTHFMGDLSFDQHYRIGDSVPLLGDITRALNGDGPDSFLGDCEECGAFIEFGAIIQSGRVVRVWPYRVSMTAVS